MENKDLEFEFNSEYDKDYLEFVKLKKAKQDYLDRYGYTEKQKLNKIIDLLHMILEEKKNEK